MTAKSTERFTLPDTDLQATFAGWQAGHFDLPSDLIRRGSSYRDLSAGSAAARVARDDLRAVGERELRTRTVDAIVAATFETGTIPDDPARPLREARKAAEDATQNHDVLTEATARAASFLDSTATMLEASIVGKYLRPAFAAVLADVRRIVPALAGIDLAEPPEGLAGTDAEGQAAFMILSRARIRLDAILAARDELGARVDSSASLPTVSDPRGWFRDVDAAPAGPPTGTIGAQFRALGPADPLSRLAWLSEDPAAALLTAAERRGRLEQWTRRPTNQVGELATR
jgi:hypothetical protein